MSKMLDYYLHVTIFYILVLSVDANIDIKTLIKIQNMFCSDAKQCQENNSLLETTEIPHSDISFSLPVIAPPTPGYYCCKECSCDKQNCDLLDSCCPDLLEYIPSVEESQSKVRMTCGSTQLRQNEPNKMTLASGWSVKMFQSCPINYPNITVVQGCEKKRDQNTTNTEVPVTDTTTLYTYRNRFCALCHGVNDSNMKFWRVQIKCVHGTFQPSKVDDVFEEIYNTETCNLLYDATNIDSFVPTRCQEVINECNVTGMWKTYDPFIEQACLAYTSVYDYRYKNVFCYMCNNHATIAPVVCQHIPSGRLDVSFVALLHFENDDGRQMYETTGRCRNNQFYDHFKDICRELSCTFPKTLQNGSCVYMVDALGGVTYGTFLKLTTLNNVSQDLNPVEKANYIGPTILSRLNATEMGAHLGVTVYAAEEALASVFQNIECIDNELIAYVEFKSSVLQPVNTLLIDRVVELDGETLEIENVTKIEYKVKIQKFSFEDDTRQKVYDHTVNKVFIQAGNSFILGDFMPALELNQNFTISLLNRCPSITINSHEFNSLRIVNGIHMHDLNINLDDNEIILENYTNSSNFSFRMCVDKYESIVEPYKHSADQNNTSCSNTDLSIKGVVSVVCTVISMSFLVITMATYLAYKELRTQPGFNNMILCASLFVAQGMFQFGVGQACNVSEMVCETIGLLVHFTWLFVLFWMNVCCVHMFRVFWRTSINAAKTVSIKLIFIYISYSLIGSGVFVSINVMVALFEGSVSTIGYGGVLCYISDNRMITYAFVVPVGMLILINISLYVLVVMKIKRTPKVQSGNRPLMERNYFQIYIKLSTLTGGTWLFGFVYLLWKVDAVEYVFIILQASQGVLLFFSFMFNSRSLKLYKDSFHNIMYSGTSNTTDSGQNSRL